MHFYAGNQDVFCPDKVPIPPRAYLAKIRILLI